jgi:singapore isolate B (sub-type 7) whole genome shotgun sequence assembly, scaffold_12
MLVVKYIKHILVAIYAHIYCFLTVPGETQTHFLRNTYLIIFYVLLMIYLWISVLQIRSGCAVWSASYRSYPTKDQYIEKVVSLDFTMKPYMINMVYRMIPFLYELNCLIDWSVTDTSCDLWNYMRIEEIRNTMFVGKYKVGLHCE